MSGPHCMHYTGFKNLNYADTKACSSLKPALTVQKHAGDLLSDTLSTKLAQHAALFPVLFSIE